MVQSKIKYLDILWHHRWFALSLFLIVMTVVFIGSKLQPEIYSVDAKIYIVPKPDTVTAGMVSNNNDYDYRVLNNQVEILASDKVAERATEYIRKKLGEKVPVSAKMLQSSLSIQRKEYSNIIDLTMSGAVKPTHLQVMMALYLDAYRDTLEAINSDKASREKDFLSRQMTASQAELADISLQLQEFEASHETYNIDTQVNQWLTMASRLDEQNKTNTAEISALKRQIATARKHLPASPETINFMSRIEHDPEANDLRMKIVKLEAERAEWGSKLTDAHPKMLAYTQELQRIKGLLAKRLGAYDAATQQKTPTSTDALISNSSLDFSLAGEIINNEIKLEAMQARGKSLLAAQHNVTGQLKDVPQQTLEYMSLKNRYEMLREKVGTLQKRLDEAALMAEVSKSFTKVETLKSPSVPNSPIRPNLTKNLTIAALLGLCLAVFSIFLRASLDRTLRWPFQINGLLPDEDNAIFTLPSLPNRKQFCALLEKTNFVVPEPYKRVIIHLENLAKSDNVRRIGIIPVSSFTDCNMATVALSLYMTELSNKMVLIDTDFSRQSVSALIGGLKMPISAAIQEGPGLSDYLSGQTEDFVDIIYPLGKTVYGSYLPSGEPVTETGFQFSHRNLGQLAENLSPNYNFVLYGLSSIAHSYDAIAVGRTLDGVLLLVHPDRSNLDQIQQAVRELETVNCRILGILFQALK